MARRVPLTIDANRNHQDEDNTMIAIDIDADIENLRLHPNANVCHDSAEEIRAHAPEAVEWSKRVEKALARASKAYLADDLYWVLEALREARHIETEHGDDPSTSGLACQLLEEVEAEETEA